MPDRAAPAVSVLMSVFNTERYVETALRSVLAQSWRDLEVIVVDDGSSDDSPRIIAALAAEDPRIRFRSRPNKGIPRTANEMIAQARGRYLCIMDSDDVMLPDCIARAAAHLDMHPEAVAVGVTNLPVDADGRSLGGAEVHLSGWSRCPATPSAFPPKGPKIINPGSMMRAEAVGRVGGYRESLPWAQDTDMWWRLSEIGEIHRINDVLLHYRRAQSSTTVRNKERALLFDIVVTLSGLARNHGLDDTALIGGFDGPDRYAETITGYATLLGQRFPVETYVLYRAVGSQAPMAAGDTDFARVLRRATRHALSVTPSAAKLKLLRRVLARGLRRGRRSGT